MGLFRDEGTWAHLLEFDVMQQWITLLLTNSLGCDATIRTHSPFLLLEFC